MEQPVGLVVGPAGQHDQIEVRLRLGVEPPLERRVQACDGLGDEIGEVVILGRHAVNASLTTHTASTNH